MTEAELLRLIKAALEHDQECASVHISLNKGNDLGANWTVSVAQAGQRVSPCYERIVEVCRGLAQKFDLED